MIWGILSKLFSLRCRVPQEISCTFPFALRLEVLCLQFLTLRAFFPGFIIQVCSFEAQHVGITSQRNPRFSKLGDLKSMASITFSFLKFMIHYFLSRGGRKCGSSTATSAYNLTILSEKWLISRFSHYITFPEPNMHRQSGCYCYQSVYSLQSYSVSTQQNTPFLHPKNFLWSWILTDTS